MYQLLQSVTRDSFGNVAPKGLSGEGYEGHYFWDTECSSAVFYNHGPDFSKLLIEYRHETLSLAVDNAKSSDISKAPCIRGGPSWAGMLRLLSRRLSAVPHQRRHRLRRHQLLPGDQGPGVYHQPGRGNIFQTARLWMDVGIFHDGKFRINDVTGPDEYTCMSTTTTTRTSWPGITWNGL
jgi:alpha,alpha-trehalose phosphorylase